MIAKLTRDLARERDEKCQDLRDAKELIEKLQWDLAKECDEKCQEQKVANDMIAKLKEQRSSQEPPESKRLVEIPANDFSKLVEMLTHPDELVSSAASKALSSLSSEDLVEHFPKLLELLNDPVEQVWFAAWNALCMVSPEEFAEHSNDLVQLATEESLRNLPAETLVELLERSWLHCGWLHGAGCDALCSTSREQLAKHVSKMDDIHRAALKALSLNLSTDQLLEMLKDSDKQVRFAACKALSTLSVDSFRLPAEHARILRDMRDSCPAANEVLSRDGSAGSGTTMSDRLVRCGAIRVF
ncbi:All3465 protein [Durusdinium trenchii]|uniref:All3465 protein n=2 Tax=Durusdinium trenchii TaxID=1381693 RepID=A0ABP0RZC0_9DINO